MRATNGAARHKMIKRVMKRASGFWSGRHKMYRVACEALRRSDVQAFAGRKLKKREFRQIWIKRISIACRLEGIAYSRLIAGLQHANIHLDRKQLSELAIHQPAAFKDVVGKAKAALEAFHAGSTASAGKFGLRPQRGGKDDLTIIEGIGPKIAELFLNAGIDSFAKLAKAPVADLQKILTAAGSRYALANPGTWPQQAALAVKGDWAALRKLMEELVGGVAK